MIKHIDHLGIAVSNLDEAIAIYRDVLGLELLGTEVVESQKVRVAMFRAGDANIDLLESTDPEGPIGKFIENKGDGIHHVAYRVDDIAAELDRLKAQDVKLINQEPVKGAHGAMVAFLHPKATGKVLTELCQK